MTNKDAIKWLKNLKQDNLWHYAQTIGEIIATMEEQEAKTGHWVIVEYDTLTCSCCGKSYYTGCDSTKEAIANLEKGNVYHYCPYCGSKMEGR